MSDRTFDLQISGYTKGGYAFTLTTRNVLGNLLAESLSWVDGKLVEMGTTPDPPGNSNGLTSNPGWPDTKICPIHKVEMQRHTKGNSHWWSHKVQLEDGTEHWCRGK